MINLSKIYNMVLLCCVAITGFRLNHGQLTLTKIIKIVAAPRRVALRSAPVTCATAVAHSLGALH